jgi:hypothetical protein
MKGELPQEVIMEYPNNKESTDSRSFGGAITEREQGLSTQKFQRLILQGESEYQ